VQTVVLEAVLLMAAVHLQKQAVRLLLQDKVLQEGILTKLVPTFRQVVVVEHMLKVLMQAITLVVMVVLG
jgi:hypothetical protein